MNGRKDQVEAIFQAAMELNSPDEREAYLLRECREDAELRREVEELLRAAVQAADVFEPRPRPAALEQAGSRIGDYHLLQRIGEGGCGVVYMSEQEAPLRRKVALKIVKLGMDTREVVARFEAERQALALMDHPNIAKVFDAGATNSGRPYFVMELVNGVPITRFCDEASLDTTQRLQLFAQVCSAIQHAHQKAVIHRDIKPSNVLVTIIAGQPMPKVIDFGVAKSTQQRLTEKTLFTEFQQFIGTPAYMSPEQAGLSGLDVDTRSDIYALGVLLYELLTGKTPFDMQALLKAGYQEIQRIIREVEPAKPSTRLSTMEAKELMSVANHRRADPKRLGLLMRGDLDWIVMKAMEKDRARRYESATDLAMDIQRHLNTEPVSARPPSKIYRVQKLVRRNLLAFAAATAVIAALGLGLGLSVWQYIDKRKAYTRALAAERLWDALSVLTTGPRKHGRSVNRASFSPDGQLLVTVSDDYTVRIWQARTGRVYRPVQPTKRNVD
jgi:serine/threonine protein kinase